MERGFLTLGDWQGIGQRSCPFLHRHNKTFPSGLHLKCRGSPQKIPPMLPCSLFLCKVFQSLTSPKEFLARLKRTVPPPPLVPCPFCLFVCVGVLSQFTVPPQGALPTSLVLLFPQGPEEREGGKPKRMERNRSRSERAFWMLWWC